MPRFTAPSDGAQLFYRDYRPATFSSSYRSLDSADAHTKVSLVMLHGSPMSSVMFENIMLKLCESHGIRCVAPDRRGFGKSDWDSPTTTEFTEAVLADDVAGLLEELELGPFVFVGSSLGAPESVLVHGKSSYVRENCKGFIWIGPVLPSTNATPTSPAAPLTEQTNNLLDAIRTSRADTVHKLLAPYMAPVDQTKLSEATLRRFEHVIGEADMLAMERCTQLMKDRDFIPELQALAAGSELPFLCLHGSHDPAIALEAAQEVKKIIPHIIIKKYEDAGHILTVTDPDKVLDDMLDFLKQHVRD